MQSGYFITTEYNNRKEIPRSKVACTMYVLPAALPRALMMIHNYTELILASHF